ncbi:unnamed protein product [Schistosoma intercalatum]|nr:unnamed protein product [Schistosoma intercalatum]
MLIEFLLILLLFNKSITNPFKNQLFYELKQNEHDHKYDIPIDNKEIELSCLYGTQWFIPSTIPYKFKPIIIVNQRKNQSKLLIKLPENNVLRTNFRGLYQCCQSLNYENMGIINWFPNEPSCCPCCPWYEQDQCLFKQSKLRNNSSVVIKLRNNTINCGSVFLYTNSVNMNTVHLDVIRDQPMLIPCPGLNSTFKEDSSVFWIDYQLTPHKSSRQIWYPFKRLEKNQFHSILYYYDNRFGVCLLKSQFPRIMLFMLCNYNQINQQRIVQPIWPMPSPVIAPTIHLYLQSINKMEHNTYKSVSIRNQSEFFLNNINWFVKYSNELLTFRVMQQTTVLRLTCIGSYTQKYIVHKPIGKLCFRWKTLNQENVKLSNISDFQEHYQFHDQSTWERTECLTTHQIFNKFSVLYAFSKYDLNLLNTSNETNQSVNNTLILCEVTTPDRMAPISRRIIQIVKTTNQISNKLHISFHCNCLILGGNQSSFKENSTLDLLIKNDSLNLNISFWTQHETDDQPFCIIKYGIHRSDQKTKETQINLIRTRDTWKCLVKMKINLPSQTITMSIGYGETKRTLQIFIIKSVLELSRNVENLQSQITQQYYLHCVPNDIERSIARKLGYNYPNNVTWFISIDNHTQNYTTYDKTLEHTFKLIPLYNATDYPRIVLNKTEKLWERINEISHLRNLYLNYWPEKLCVRCSSVYEIGMHFNGQESCAVFNDFNVIDTLKNTENNRHIQNIRKKWQLYFVIELNNSSQFHEVNSQLNNSEISLVQSTSMSLECIRKMHTKPEQLKLKEWPELTIINTQNSTEDHLTNTTFWILSPYSLKVRKIIHLNKSLVVYLKCSYKSEQYVIKIHTFKQNVPKILKPTENVQLIRTNLQQHTVLNYSINTDNMTKNSIELICQAVGSPKPSIQWMRAVYNQSESFIKWENVHTCSVDENKIQFNISINGDQEIQTCIYNISTLLLTSKDTLNQSHYQCLAKNIAGNAFKQIKLIYLDTISIHSNETIKLQMMKKFVSWIYLIILPIILILITMSIILWLCYKISYKNQCSSDISLPNVLYKNIYNRLHSYHYKSSSSSLLTSYSLSKDYKSIEQVLSQLLGFTVNTTVQDTTNITTTTTTSTAKRSMNQINKWIIPRKFIKRSNYPLGSGHYGSVFKAWLHSSYIKDTLNNEFKDILLREDTENYIVALKVSSMVEKSAVNSNNTNDSSKLICLKNEIRILSNLTNCDNIIRMIGIMFESNLKRNRSPLNGVNLILECCKYKSLAHFIRCHSHQIIDSLINYEEVQLTNFCMKDNKMNTHDRTTLGEYRLTVKEIYRFAYGIISGIVYLVKNYVIHRDLATRNILINHNYIPKISDFGLAVQMTPMNGLRNDDIYNIDGEFNEDQLIDEYYRVLTPRKKLPLRILPPEALLQHKFYFSSDIWQYGLLIWELFHLEKREPFQEIKTFQELVGMLSEHNLNNNKNNGTDCNSNVSGYTLKKTTNCQRLLPPSTLDRPILVNDELWEMMCQMWSYNPHKRPTAAQIHDKIKYLLDDTKETFSCIDFQYNCHEHRHHKHHICTYKNCRFLSDTSFIEVHNQLIHSYENTIQST